MENFKPQTVNLRLQAMNKYLEFSKQEKLKMKFVKAQQKTFGERHQRCRLQVSESQAKD